ncbi:oligosaccharyl transferase subunit [Trypanosoma cruzi cruzi]|uniref:dolichyl-diphosphooligosaccharide--protein glycotransferase n=1 Tax=Trypanosoma cruzi TaxID=5693 RepID=A0A2V2VM99_TRYCR|nr:oligosaccharyl transferase subunit [Trypanosoma cruzi cruzi]PWU97440.1 putative oligosaccharyl transferase subunit [Trypanosoma cruzi]PWU97441.1 putative oligosaccharyl transferase subunit [Trypanosoma cruzi]
MLSKGSAENKGSAGKTPPKSTKSARAARTEKEATAVDDSSVENVYFLNAFPIPNSVLRTSRVCVLSLLMVMGTLEAYTLRLIPIHIYGKVIHEFDPWFNFRASEYLDEHGWDAFFHWYDYMSWYPLGRPVGTTIFPGLQITSVLIRRALSMLGVSMTMNDVCCLIPAWFGSVATVLAALLAYETWGSFSGAAMTAGLFAILPAHLMRSMAGEYDNECIAMAAMLLTFYLWVRSLRNAGSWPIGVLTGLAYGYMVSTWGGFIFVLNMVALHAAVCVFADWMRGRYDASLLWAYSLFFVVGTAIATRVPPVGWTPFKSLEQLMALLVFIFMWALHFSEILRRRADVPICSTKALRIRARVFMITCGVLVLAAALLAPQGYFGPLSSRVRALFVQHTRTGNPLVDSVAEHMPTSADAFWSYFHICLPGSLLGFFVTLFLCSARYHHGKSFILLYYLVAYYFSTKMSRLMLLSGPAAVVLTGNMLGGVMDLSVDSLFLPPGVCEDGKKRQMKGRHKQKDFAERVETRISTAWKKMCRRRPFFAAALVGALLVLGGHALLTSGYREHCHQFAEAVSGPQIIMRAQLRTGEIVMLDDYYVSYLWLRNNTPADARILAWWDYGYQITGIGNRTSLADGNTWNHEHIATIGKLLTSPVAKAHLLIRHLADYVLIWTGSRAEDLMKSPHMARIGNSVYRDICTEDDPLCSNFGFEDYDLSRPTPMMRMSLLYNLHVSGEHPSPAIDNMFRLAYRSRHGLVKIYKVMNVSAESKAWVADPKNRKCDAPGSWLCAGQYPPAKEIQEMLARRIDYGQLEDFNRGKRDDAYYRAYMRRIRNEGRG